jgi:hypothetical protein
LTGKSEKTIITDYGDVKGHFRLFRNWQNHHSAQKRRGIERRTIGSGYEFKLNKVRNAFIHDPLLPQKRFDHFKPVAV